MRFVVDNHEKMDIMKLSGKVHLTTDLHNLKTDRYFLGTCQMVNGSTNFIFLKGG